jgi:hypothetical protein
MQRRKIRYWLYKYKKEALEGRADLSNGAPKGLKEHFEGQSLFTGWENFAENWDLPHVRKGCTLLTCLCASEVVPLEAVRRYKGINEEWDDLLMTQTKVISMKPVGEKED